MTDRVCPKCGGDEFYASQRCYVDIVVDGFNEFLRNASENGELSVSDAEKPYGPYQCLRCKEEFDNLDSLKEVDLYRFVFIVCVDGSILRKPDDEETKKWIKEHEKTCEVFSDYPKEKTYKNALMNLKSPALFSER